MQFRKQPATGAGEKQERRRTGTLRRAAAVVAAAVLVPLVGASATASGAPVRQEPARASAATSLGSGFTEGRVTVEGVPLHYVRGGSGPALVLLHGWPQTWWAWKNVMPELARSRTVIAFDLPGLGDSGIPRGGYDKASTARRLHTAVRKLGFRQVELMAHDIGTLVAYPYARDYPQDVTRLIAMETPLAGFGLEELAGLSWHFTFNMTPAPIPERIMDNEDVPTFLDYIFDSAYRRDSIDRRVYYRAYRNPAHRSAGYGYFRSLQADIADNHANAAKRLPMPVLAMGAQYSFGPRVAASFRLVGDDVREVVVPDSGHFIPEENPAYLISCARLFFGITSAPSSPDLAPCAR